MIKVFIFFIVVYILLNIGGKIYKLKNPDFQADNWKSGISLIFCVPFIAINGLIIKFTFFFNYETREFTRFHIDQQMSILTFFSAMMAIEVVLKFIKKAWNNIKSAFYYNIKKKSPTQSDSNEISNESEAEAEEITKKVHTEFNILFYRKSCDKTYCYRKNRK